MASTKAAAGEFYTTQLHDGRWCACQITYADHHEVELLALDWIGAEPPSLSDLEGTGPLLLDHEGTEEPCRINAGPVPPWRFNLVGEAKPLATFAHRCASWSGWGYVPYQVLARWRWGQEVSDELKTALARLRDQGSEKIEVPLDGVVHQLDTSTWRLWLGPEDLPGVAHHLKIDPEGEIPWDRFEPLLRLSEVNYTGGDPAFLAFLARRPFITRVLWRGHGLRVLDFARTRIETLSVEVGEGPLEIHLSKLASSLHLLDLEGEAHIRVHDPREGWGVGLSLAHREIPKTIEGLPSLRSLTARGLHLADANKLARFPGLQSVTLQGAPGALAHPEALAELPQLRELILRDFYTMDAERFPALSRWPALDTFEVSGLRERHAELLGERLMGVRVLSIRGVKTDAWVRANLDNPFRDWVDADARLGRAACTAFRKAATALGKLDASTPELELREVLLSFVVAFNTLDDTWSLDSTKAEEVADAFQSLLDECPPSVDQAKAFEWFDRWRDF